MDQEWRDSTNMADVAAAVTAVQQRFPGARVWLLGLSNGAWSAAHAGAALQDKLAGVILMSVAQARSRPEACGHRIPVLVVQHRRDACLPYRNIEAQARWHTLVTVDDARLPRPGRGDSAAAAEAAHNFYGSEAAVMAAVAEWINTGKAPEYINQEKTQ